LVFRDFDDKDFDDDKLSQFLRLAQISPLLDTPHILRSLHVAEIQQGKTLYYNSAMMFFAKNLDFHFFHTTVTCALYKGREKVDILDRKDFNRDLKFNVDESMLFLERHLSVRYEFNGSPRRKEIPEIPLEALREAVLNAVIHRDYFEKGANVMVEIFANRVEITSPGGLPKGLNPKEFGTRSILRNPNLANLFHRIEYIEKMGTGIKRIQKMISEAGLPPVQYKWDNYVKAVFSSVEEKSGQAFGKHPQKTTQETTQEKIIGILKLNSKITRKEISERIGLSTDGVKYHLDALRRSGRIRHVGSTKKGWWEVMEKQDDI